MKTLVETEDRVAKAEAYRSWPRGPGWVDGHRTGHPGRTYKAPGRGEDALRSPPGHGLIYHDARRRALLRQQRREGQGGSVCNSGDLSDDILRGDDRCSSRNEDADESYGLSPLWFARRS
jgi:hypothetical protein